MTQNAEEQTLLAMTLNLIPDTVWVTITARSSPQI